MFTSLNPRQSLFVENYLIDLNGKEAALRAGYEAPHAKLQAVRLLGKAKIRGAIGTAMVAREERTGITAERVIVEYERIAFADPRRFADWGRAGVRPRGNDTLSAEDTCAIAEIVAADDGGSGGEVRHVKLFDKMAALRSLSRIFDYRDRARFPRAAAPALLREKDGAPKAGRYSARHQLFADEYLKDFNGTAAALRAGYSPTTGLAQLRRAPGAVQAIEAAMVPRLAAIRIEADRVLREYARIAFADIGRIARWDAASLRVKAQPDIAHDDSAAIADIGPGRGGAWRLRLHDKVHALDVLAQHLGLLDPKMPGRAEWFSDARRRTSAALRQRVGRG